MAGKVTNEQIRNAGNISVDDFRKAVNYENTKNKGYVRFVPDGKGGVRIGKVNNKIDFMIGWRTNIGTANNTAMREKFASSFKDALRWADRGEIDGLLDKIRNNADGTANTAALSRKEIESAFSTYDRHMNTVSGRLAMIDNLLGATAAKCGFTADRDGINRFKEKFFNLAGALAALADATKTDEATGKFTMDEAGFRTALDFLEQACKEAERIAETDRAIKAIVQNVASDGVKNDFGLHLSVDDTAKLRAVLLRYLQQKGFLTEKNGGTGHGLAVFNKFMEDVLPRIYEQQVKAAHALGEGVDTDGVMSVWALLNDAEAFMAGAKAYLKNPPKLYNATEDKSVNAILEGSEQLAETSENIVKDQLIIKGVNDIIREVNIPAGAKRPGEPQTDPKGWIDLPALEREGLLDVFAEKFLSERGLAKTGDKEKEHTKAFHATLDEITKAIRQTKIAATIQFGRKTADNATGGAGMYIAHMCEAIRNSTDGIFGTMPELRTYLTQYTLPNIMNVKIGLAADNQAKNPGLDTDPEVEGRDRGLLDATAEAYIRFSGEADNLAKQEKTMFRKLLDTAEKKGRIGKEENAKIHDQIQNRINAARSAAAKEFFLESPVEDGEEGAKKLMRIFNGKLNDVRAELKNEIIVATLGRTVGVEIKTRLVDIEGRIGEALENPDFNAVHLGEKGVMDDHAALQILRSGALKRLYTDVLAEKLSKLKADGENPAVDAKFLDSVQSEFNKRALKLANGVMKAKNALVAKYRELVEEGTGKAIEARNYGLDRKANAALVKEVSGEVMQHLSSRFRKLVEVLLDAHESFKADDISALAEDFVSAKGIESVGVAFDKVMEARRKAVEGFIGQDGENRLLEKVMSGGIFGENGTFAGIGANERDAIKVNVARDIVKSVLARAEANAPVYATNDPDALLGRLAQEAEKELKEFTASWSKFRAGFLKNTADGKIDTLTLGAEQVAKIRDWILSTLVSDAQFRAKPDMDRAVKNYTEYLHDEVNAIIEEQRKELENRIKEIDKVLKPALKRLNEDVKKAYKDNFRRHVSIGADEHFIENVLPKMEKAIRDRITQDPTSFSREKIEERTAELQSGFIGLLGRVILANSFATDGLTGDLLENFGAGDLANDAVKMKQVKTDIATFMDSESGDAIRAEAEKALMDLVFDTVFNGGDAIPDVTDAYAFKPAAPGNPVDRYREAVRGILDGHAVPLLHDTFDGKKTEETRARFEEWLGYYSLSRTKAYREIDVHDLIMTRFDERVSILQKAVIDEGAAVEPVLSKDFMDEIDRIIDTAGAEMMIKDWKDALAADWMARFADDPAWRFFNTEDPGFANLPSGLQEVIGRSREELAAALSIAISGIAGENVGTGSLDDLRNGLDAITSDNVFERIKGDMATTIEACTRRYLLETGASTLVDYHIRYIQSELIGHVVGERNMEIFPNGLIDILGNVSLDDLDAYQTVANACTSFIKSIADTVDAVLESAKTDDLSLTAFAERLKDRADDFVRNALEDENSWKGILRPALEAIDKASGKE